MAKEQVQAITKMEEDFAQWYTDIVKKAELVDYSSVKGCMILRPYGYALWENMQKVMDEKLKETGHENVYMPMFIPESLLQKEKDHVEGFAPEVAWVTHGGDEKLAERLCVRPTSETLFCEHFSKIVQSYNDLPKLYNQWCSVVRWEKTTRPFLRTTEFLWQEGHTIHETAEESQAETLNILNYALHTDLYQINMAYTYWKDGIHNRRSVFDLYFRKLPFENGYAVFAGLEKIVEYIENFSFTESDIAYLAELQFEEEFLHYLQNMKFTGTIRSMQEGEVVFNNEPLLRVDAPLGEAQIIETALLNIVNYQTLIATKAARMKHAASNDELLEFGTRRAHEFDAALWGTRAAFIGGFSSTSNVRAGKRFGIPVAGTHAHSFVQAYRDEYVAFKKIR